MCWLNCAPTGVAPLAKTFRAMGKELKKVAKILSGHETGFREIHDIQIVSQLAMMLALDPEVDSRRHLARTSLSQTRHFRARCVQCHARD